MNANLLRNGSRAANDGTRHDKNNQPVDYYSRLNRLETIGNGLKYMDKAKNMIVHDSVIVAIYLQIGKPQNTRKTQAKISRMNF